MKFIDIRSLIPIFILVNILYISPIYSSEITKDINGNEFCEKLSDESLYKKHALSSYRVLFPGYDGWVFRDRTDFIEDFSLRKGERDVANLARLTKAFKDNGIDFVVARLPTRGMTNPKKILAEYDYDVEKARNAYTNQAKELRENGVNVVTINNWNIKNFYYPNDQHWSADGAKAMAKELTEFISSLPSYDDIDKMDFVTIVEGDEEIAGAFRKATKKICNQDIASIKVKHYKTYNRDDKDIFGELSNPDIVLIGTSNSTNPLPSYANFEGFLKEYLRADIDNRSISGGGLDSSMIAWLNSDSYKIHKPKIVIWETPGYYNDIGSLRYVRQFIPAIYGKCTGENLVADKIIKTAEGKTLLFDDLEKMNIKGSNYYVRFEFSEKVKKRWYVSLFYDENRIDRFRFAREKTYPYDGIFYIQLSDFYVGNVKNISIDLHQKMSGVELHSQICRIAD